MSVRGVSECVWWLEAAGRDELLLTLTTPESNDAKNACLY